MQYEIVSSEKFIIVGISVRTNNSNNQAKRDISRLWGQFILDNHIDTIPNKISNDIYCLYTDYESDHTGDYTTILGCIVSHCDNIPEDMMTKEIPMGNYMKFTSEGKLPESVAQTWDFIWNSNFDRTYIADFEVYGIASQNPDNAIVTTYLSIK